MLADRRLVIATIGLLVVLPMCFPRDLGALAWVSMAAVGPTPIFLLMLCLSHAPSAPLVLPGLLIDSFMCSGALSAAAWGASMPRGLSCDTQISAYPMHSLPY